MTIWGNHSSTQVPDVEHASVAGEPATELVDPSWVDDEFIPTVQQRGAAIIGARGASSAASAANAAVDHVRDWLLGTASGDWTSMAIPSQGHYGVPEGIIYSFPVTCEDGRIAVVEGLDRSDAVVRRMEASAAELLEERAAVEHLI
jgi:malate dehydrogenase